MPTLTVPINNGRESAHTPSLHSCKTPLVLEGACIDWEACKLWLDLRHFLKNDAQNMAVDVSVSPNTDFSGDEERRQTVRMRFSTFVDVMCALEKGESHPATELGLTYYLCQAPIYVPANRHRDPCAPTHAILPHLSRDVTVPACVPEDRLVTANVWMATAGDKPIRSNLHYDVHQNLLCVVRGRKRVRLLPPSMTPLLEAQPVYTGSANHSARPELWLDNPPENCWVMEAVVEAGSGLLIPEGWWHQVDSDPSTIAVNFWFHSDLPATLMTVPHKFRLSNEPRDYTADTMGEEDKHISSKEIDGGNLDRGKRKWGVGPGEEEGDSRVKNPKIGKTADEREYGDHGGMSIHSEINTPRVGDVGMDVYYARVLIGGLVEKYAKSNLALSTARSNQSDVMKGTKFGNLTDLQPIIDGLRNLGAELTAGNCDLMANEAAYNALRSLDIISYTHVYTCLARGPSDIWKVIVDSMPNSAAAGLLSHLESTQTLHTHPINPDNSRAVNECSGSRPDSEPPHAINSQQLIEVPPHAINSQQLIEVLFVEPFGEEEAERMLNTIEEKRRMFSKEMLRLVLRDVLGACDV